MAGSQIRVPQYTGAQIQEIAAAEVQPVAVQAADAQSRAADAQTAVAALDVYLVGADINTDSAAQFAIDNLTLNVWAVSREFQRLVKQLEVTQ